MNQVDGPPPPRSVGRALGMPAWGGSPTLQPISPSSDGISSVVKHPLTILVVIKNMWDPSLNHVGINANSIASVANVTLKSSIKKDL
ncbi:hypothetical protein DVH24_030828 [Malus domestica]|uniref:Uncharacterized protein n=1 Tax=Malus domestica TaxID=3750 RepID=A0A498HGB0_MALDO|nr:hypothetical protein DVH24_030828 [Malus domestica]